MFRKECKQTFYFYHKTRHTLTPKIILGCYPFYQIFFLSLFLNHSCLSILLHSFLSLCSTNNSITFCFSWVKANHSNQFTLYINIWSTQSTSQECSKEAKSLSHCSTRQKKLQKTDYNQAVGKFDYHFSSTIIAPNCTKKIRQHIKRKSLLFQMHLQY